MAKEKDRPPSSPQFTDTPPTSYQSTDYSFLEIVMGMQGTLGKLTEAVESLKAQSKEHSAKLDTVTHSVHGAKVGLWVVGVIIAAGGSMCGFILKLIFDVIVELNKKR